MSMTSIPKAKLFANLLQIIAPKKLYSTKSRELLLKPQNINRYWKTVFKGETTNIAPHKLIQVNTEKQMIDLINSTVFKKKEQSSVLNSLEMQECCLIYKNFEYEKKKLFLKILSHEFGYSINEIVEKTKKIHEKSLNCNVSWIDEIYLEIKNIQNSLVPGYDEFFHKIHRMPDGFSFLVHLRGDILKMHKLDNADIKLKYMSDYLKSKIESWIIGTLDLKQITWNSSAYTIEKLGEYESVHSVRSLEDIKRRLGNGRRCFGFFHKNAPLEPLVFVWIALTSGVTKNIKEILDTDSPYVDELAESNTAIFYSINSQQGVSGVDLGNFLIKRVVRIIQSELPNIKTFCTLSPMPGFSNWLNLWALTDEDLQDSLLLNAKERESIISLNYESISWKKTLIVS
ncbi:hypothetical protein BB561_006595 [Smittium simulii]|uniref:Malonyl-CoA decarboxylase C-terminal domain-containing protein n=1 Tax=Smittium simulii TaxID=133385 RepID=A0A2T9Y2X9_9FUNG|nr:hypothetical protein BB561_006595 [Smittium simulii]